MRRRRRRRNNQRKIIITVSLCLLFIMTAGYAAFQTNLNITAKGNAKGRITAADQLKETVVNSGDGLYLDTYESTADEKKYFYKGANPNNYINFNCDENNENCETWRIVSVEKDKTLKIMKRVRVDAYVWDDSNARDSSTSTYCKDVALGCNAWMMSDNFANDNHSGTVIKDATLNTYLNNIYYNTLGDDKTLIEEHSWAVGGVDTSALLTSLVETEKAITWNGKVGLLSASEYLRANSNIENCANKADEYDYRVCNSTNYVYQEAFNKQRGAVLNLITFTKNENSTFYVCDVSYDYGGIGYNNASNQRSTLPVVYLIKDITLEGEGTEDNPYTIISTKS